MADLLRRVCYPLVLPFIVGAVWLHAWALRQDSRAFPRLPPHPPAAGGLGADRSVVRGPAPGSGSTYRVFGGDDSVASVEADDEE